MIVTFCGHAHFSKSEEYEQQILAFLEEKVGDQPADIYMVEMADYVVAYVSHDWGGAYNTYKHAKRKGKEIFNLANLGE